MASNDLFALHGLLRAFERARSDMASRLDSAELDALRAAADHDSCVIITDEVVYRLLNEIEDFRTYATLMPAERAIGLIQELIESGMREFGESNGH